MSTQAEQIIAAVAAESGIEPEEIIDRLDPDAKGVAYEIAKFENWRPYYVRHRQILRLSSGELVATEWNEGLGKHAWTEPRAEAYRVVGREVTATKYVREES